MLDVTPGALLLSNNGPPVLGVTPGELHLANKGGAPVLDVEDGTLSLATNGDPVLAVEAGKLSLVGTEYRGAVVLDVKTGELHLKNAGPPVLDVTPGELHLANKGGARYSTSRAHAFLATNGTRYSPSRPASCPSWALRVTRIRSRGRQVDPPRTTAPASSTTSPVSCTSRTTALVLDVEPGISSEPKWCAGAAN